MHIQAYSPDRTATLNNLQGVKEQESQFVTLITANQGIVHKVCNMYAQAGDGYDDLFQEILLQLWRSYRSYRGDSKLSTWMYRVALNTAISSVRKKKRGLAQTSISDAELEIPVAPGDADAEEKKKFLYQAISGLSKVERAIIMLHLEDHSYQEIAEIMGITRNHVGVKLTRIKNKLKKILQPHFS